MSDNSDNPNPNPKPFQDDGSHDELPVQPENLPYIKNAPTPEQRSLIITDALKAHFPQALLVPKLGEREQAIKHLEHHTIRILRVHEHNIRAALNNGIAYTQQMAAMFGGTYNPEFKNQVDKQVYEDIKQAFATESKEALHTMLCVVLVGMWTEKLEEIC